MKLLQQALSGQIPEDTVTNEEQIDDLYKQLKADPPDPYGHYFVMRLLPVDRERDLKIIGATKKKIKYPEHLLALASMPLLRGRSSYLQDIVKALREDHTVPHDVWSKALKHRFQPDIEWVIIGQAVKTSRGEAEKIIGIYMSCMHDKKRLNCFMNTLDNITLSAEQCQAIIDSAQSTENPAYIQSLIKGKWPRRKHNREA